MAQVTDDVIASDMIALIDLIKRQLGQVDFAAFAADRDKVDATAYRLQALGEYSMRLSETFKQRHDAPWQKMRGMRNILSHSYDYVDPHIIWLVVIQELDPLRLVLAEGSIAP